MASRFSSKPSARSGGSRGETQRLDAAFVERFPVLYEYLTRDKYEDGKPRQTATISLMIEDGAAKGCLNDRDCSRSVWVTSDSPQSILSALEAALSADVEPDWRYYQGWGKGKKK